MKYAWLLKRGYEVQLVAQEGIWDRHHRARSADDLQAVSNETNHHIETESEGDNVENIEEDQPDEDEDLLEDLRQDDDEHIESSRDTMCILLEAV